MKLRTKLTVFSILLLAAAIALCCAIIISFAYQGEVESITSAGIFDFEDLYREFVWSSTDSIPDSPIVRRSYIINKFRSLADAGEFVLQKGDEFWVNNTGFDVKSILSAGKAAKLSESGSTQYKLARIDGADYFIATSPASIAQEDYYVSLMRNVTPQINSVRSLAAKCALVGAVITAIAAYAMHLIVLRSLLPIKALQEGANQLSGGKYAERIPVHGHDELSELAADFNSMAEAIEGNMQELNERAERQQAFINDLSHELKTPVTSILLSSETLLSRSVPPDAAQNALVRIYDQCKWLEQLSGKLMTLVLLQGEISLREESVAELLEAVKESTADKLEKQNMKLCLNCEMDTLPMDFDLMRSALVNLVENARKASRDGQTIYLCAKNNTIEVRDFGQGIPAKELPRITEPFYMVDKSRSKKQGGAGLGLAIVQRIASAHGATLTAESIPGEFTAIKIVFLTK